MTHLGSGIDRKAADDGSHFLREAAGDDHQISLAWRGAENFSAEASEVKARSGHGHHLDGAAGQPEEAAKWSSCAPVHGLNRRVVKMMPSSARRFPKSSGFVSVRACRVMCSWFSVPAIFRTRNGGDKLSADLKMGHFFIRVSGQVGDGCLDGPWCKCLCGGEAPYFARAPNQRTHAATRTEVLRTRRAIAKVAVSASGVYRCW